MTPTQKQGLREAAQPIHKAQPRDGGGLRCGSSPALVRDSILEALHAVHDAMEKVGETAPNGRDYKPATLDLAIAAHLSRMARLASVAAELGELFDSWEDA